MAGKKKAQAQAGQEFDKVYPPEGNKLLGSPSPGGHNIAEGLVCLFWIMKRFDIATLISLGHSLYKAQMECDILHQANNKPGDVSWFIRICEAGGRYCKSVGFEHSAMKAFTLTLRLKQRPLQIDYSGIQAELRCLEEDVLLEMGANKFLQIPVSLSTHFNNKDLIGKEAYEAFPEAREDIVEAGNAISVGLDTAAVFHFMRVVEWGLRALARDVGLNEVVADKKSGKIVPLEWAQWEKILNQMHGKIEEKIRLIARGPDRQRAQEFYYQAEKEIDGFKDAWRNHVMHCRRIYSSSDSLAVLSHVQRFMKSLADYGIGQLQP